MTGSDIFGSLADLDTSSFLENDEQMSPEFVPYPPTEAELAPYRCFFQITPDHIHDASDQTQVLPASALPANEPAHPPPTGSEPDHQPPPQQGAPGQDDPSSSSRDLVLVPNSTTPPPPPPTTTNTSTTTTKDPKNKQVLVDIGSDSESDDSNEVRVHGSFTSLDLPLVACTPPPTTTTLSTSRFGESAQLKYPVSCITPSGHHIVFSRGETTDDERTDTDDDMPPSPPSLQQSLEQQLAAVVNEINYWSKMVNKASIQEEPERPDWLPEGWEMRCVTRTNGSSAGNRDKYYIEPGVKGRQFRSKREVLEFLKTGKRRQYKRKANSTAMTSTVNRPFEGTSSSSWQIIRTASHLEASTSRQNEETPNLDSDTVPEKQNEETPPNVDSDQNPPKRPRGTGSPSKSLRDRVTELGRKEAITAAPQGSTSYSWN